MKNNCIDNESMVLVPFEDSIALFCWPTSEEQLAAQFSDCFCQKQSDGTAFLLTNKFNPLDADG